MTARRHSLRSPVGDLVNTMRERAAALPQALRGSASIKSLNDQHAYMRIEGDDELSVGDLVGCGISHPCTTFDKWRALFTVDDDYRVTGAIRTFF